MIEKEAEVRIDKWLWAARFFKTRALAKAAVETGKVLCNDQRTKPSKLLEPGANLSIRRNELTWQIKVLKLSHRRGPAPEAQTLYEETQESILIRQKCAEQRKSQQLLGEVPAKRPSKKDRRKIIQFRKSSL